MTLSKTLLNFLEESARQAGAVPPNSDDDLFQTGVLDSFLVVDLVAQLEEEYHIKIPDQDVNAGNFRSIKAIELYLDSRKS